MNEIDQILAQKPDHEGNADNFLQLIEELKGKYPDVITYAVKSESINPPEGLVDWMERKSPGIKLALAQEAARKGEESLERTTVISSVEGNDKTLVQTVFSEMEKLAYESGGLENVEHREYLDRVEFIANLEGAQADFAAAFGNPNPRYKISTFFDFK
jgi:hypothetical protein